MSSKNSHRNIPISFYAKRLSIVLAFVLFVFIVGFSQSYANSQNSNGSDVEHLSLSKKYQIIKKDKLVSQEDIVVKTSNAIWKIGDYNQEWTDQKQKEAALMVQQPSVRTSVKEVYGKKAPSNVHTGAWSKVAPLAPGNKYVPGNCTWYAYNRRYAMGRPVGSMWGNGGSWHYSARSAGYSVNHKPKVGDVIDMPHHVAIVEAVGDKNTVYISEMNYGWSLYSYNHRWIANASSYWFIH